MEQQRSPEWFEKRRGRITGSNVGAILGLNPFRTQDDVLREMVRTYHGAEREFQGNAATEWGTFNEAGAQQDYEMQTANNVEETGFHVHPKHDWLGASPDGLVHDFGLIEIKCPYGQREKNPPEFKTAEEQPHYWAQMQIEMYCTQSPRDGMCRDFCDFYQWAPHGSRLERVWIDHDWLALTIPKLQEFYARYLSELDNPEHLEPKLKPISTRRTRLLVDEYHDLSESMEAAKARQKEIMDELVKIAGQRNALVCGHKLTKVKRQGSVSYAKALKDLAPDADLEPYRGEPSEFWKLTRSAKK